MSIAENYLDVNRELWNNKTAAHINSDFYNLKAFKEGATSLMPIELAQVGDVSSKTLLHLQCHFGMDTLSWARLGAQVTGVDFSEQAIQAAQNLASEVNVEARFIHSNVYDLQLYEQFDIVFTSYGVIGWLPDLDKWAEVIAAHFKPGGAFHFIEFHPVVWMLNDDFQSITYSYFNREPIVEEVTGTYADRAAPIAGTSVSWNHSLADVLNALLQKVCALHILQNMITLLIIVFKIPSK